MARPMATTRKLDDSLREQLRANLAKFEHSEDWSEDLRQAAVAIVVTDDAEGDPGFLITRRPQEMRRHPGQWALPGGRVDEGESLLEAGLRELREELAISLGPADVLGTLDVYETRSGFAITPIVLWGGSNLEPVPDPSEVAELHHVPLSELEKPEVPRFDTIPESDRPVIVLPIIGAEINAPTAAVLYQFVEVAVRGKSTRVSHFEQPVFAWK